MSFEQVCGITGALVLGGLAGAIGGLILVTLVKILWLGTKAVFGGK